MPSVATVTNTSPSTWNASGWRMSWILVAPAALPSPLSASPTATTLSVFSTWLAGPKHPESTSANPKRKPRMVTSVSEETPLGSYRRSSARPRAFHHTEETHAQHAHLRDLDHSVVVPVAGAR